MLSNSITLLYPHSFFSSLISTQSVTPAAWAESLSSFSSTRSRATKQTQETKPHPSVSALYQGTVADHLLNADVLPMVCPPVPWTGPRYGGFLLRRGLATNL